MIVDWIASAFIIPGMWLIGNKNKWGQALLLCSQPFFLLVIIFTQAWGLFPLNVIMWYISIRNTVKWFREDKKRIKDTVKWYRRNNKNAL